MTKIPMSGNLIRKLSSLSVDKEPVKSLSEKIQMSTDQILIDKETVEMCSDLYEFLSVLKKINVF